MERKLNPSGRPHGHDVDEMAKRKAKPSVPSSVYASDELIAERHAEAAKEDEEARRWLRERKNKQR